MTKLYSEITPDHIALIANSWDENGRFDRHVNTWLAEHGFAWDPTKTDDDNRDDFYQVVDWVLDFRS